MHVKFLGGFKLFDAQLEGTTSDRGHQQALHQTTCDTLSQVHKYTKSIMLYSALHMFCTCYDTWYMKHAEVRTHLVVEVHPRKAAAGPRTQVAHVFSHAVLVALDLRAGVQRLVARRHHLKFICTVQYNTAYICSVHARYSTDSY